jgi:long-chain acyl-CoA synthetase
MANLAENLLRSAAAHPDRPAIRLGDTVLTYRELESHSARAARLLAELGVRRTDRVGIMMPNTVCFPVLYYGALRLGAIVVPMNPLLKSREIAHYVHDADMTLLLAHTAVPAEELSDLRDATQLVQVEDSTLLPELTTRQPLPGMEAADPSDTAVILYTSGTTGRPKGAELTHENLRRNCEISVEMSDLGPSDVAMGCLPLFHAFGQSVAMNACIRAGALLTLLPRFDAAAALQVIERDAVTIFNGVPTMYTALLNYGPGSHTITSLRMCVSGGASLPGEILRRFQETFGARILEGYGLSETSPSATFNRPECAKVGSIGTPVPGVELKLVAADGSPTPVGEVGEISVRGHNVMKGYWHLPKETEKAIRDGWFFTGDLAREDYDGFFYIVDRLKEVIIRGGLNVYPREIEEVLYEHPAVLEAAVVGVPHPLHGEEVVAAVALQPGKAASGKDLCDFVKARVAPYKYPRDVQIFDTLPKGATGKILKRAIEFPSIATTT